MCDMLQDPVNSASSQQLKLRESSFWGDDPILKKIVNEIEIGGSSVMVK